MNRAPNAPFFPIAKQAPCHTGVNKLCRRNTLREAARSRASGRRREADSLAAPAWSGWDMLKMLSSA